MISEQAPHSRELLATNQVRNYAYGKGRNGKIYDCERDIHAFLLEEGKPQCIRPGDLEEGTEARRCYWRECKPACDQFKCERNGQTLRPVYDTQESIEAYFNYLLAQGIPMLQTINGDRRRNFHEINENGNVSLCFVFGDPKNKTYTEQEISSLRSSVEVVFNEFTASLINETGWKRSHVPVALREVRYSHQGIQVECPPDVLCTLDESEPLTLCDHNNINLVIRMYQTGGSAHYGPGNTLNFSPGYFGCDVTDGERDKNRRCGTGAHELAHLFSFPDLYPYLFLYNFTHMKQFAREHSLPTPYTPYKTSVSSKYNTVTEFDYFVLRSYWLIARSEYPSPPPSPLPPPITPPLPPPISPPDWITANSPHPLPPPPFPPRPITPPLPLLPPAIPPREIKADVCSNCSGLIYPIIQKFIEDFESEDQPWPLILTGIPGGDSCAETLEPYLPDRLASMSRAYTEIYYSCSGEYLENVFNAPNPPSQLPSAAPIMPAMKSPSPLPPVAPIIPPIQPPSQLPSAAPIIPPIQPPSLPGKGNPLNTNETIAIAVGASIIVLLLAGITTRLIKRCHSIHSVTVRGESEGVETSRL